MVAPRCARGGGSVELEVDERHDHRGDEEHDEDPEERPSQKGVAALELAVVLGQATSGSRAIATNRSARYASEKWNSSRARAGDVCRASRQASQMKAPPSATAHTR